MESKFTQNDLLAHINQFWSVLDDMAENNPESYQKFIQRHIKEGKNVMSAPEPHLCLQTKILDPEERVLYINICRWHRVPAPQSEAHPVPLSSGRLEIMSEEAVADIAYNPDVLKKAEKDHVELDQLIRLAIKYIEQHHRVTLCHSYHIAPFTLRGTLQRLKDNLLGVQKNCAANKPEPKPAVNESLLEQLKNITVKGEKEEAASPPIHITKADRPGSARPCLIEEISSTEHQEEELLSAPHHELSVTRDHSGKPQMLILKAELKGVLSVSQCDLSVSQDDLMLEVSERYRLHLTLPEIVNEETVRAKYNKARQVLTVTMSVL
ncbi:PIH1 domain-containing protein 2 [Bombina bombina]|uniref:PIH1 domain-containing protein 2 n=1 Tax=Bombina bombina TaxID=8345 RepID=UPI00235A7DF9|nr:PIH1 domain-containing protein 2 [Bombina bombina]